MNGKRLTTGVTYLLSPGFRQSILNQLNVISRGSFSLGMAPGLESSFYNDNPLNSTGHLSWRSRMFSHYGCHPRGFLAATLPPPPITHILPVEPKSNAWNRRNWDPWN